MRERAVKVDTQCPLTECARCASTLDQCVRGIPTTEMYTDLELEVPLLSFSFSPHPTVEFVFFLAQGRATKSGMTTLIGSLRLREIGSRFVCELDLQSVRCLLVSPSISLPSGRRRSAVVSLNRRGVWTRDSLPVTKGRGTHP